MSPAIPCSVLVLARYRDYVWLQLVGGEVEWAGVGSGLAAGVGATRREPHRTCISQDNRVCLGFSGQLDPPLFYQGEVKVLPGEQGRGCVYPTQLYPAGPWCGLLV
ncbi:hypothetical protein Pmani_016377 [Petrolisthes manimaculis]|uniref:Uncharacterized protein n=1 Tax=Petrolisthes manimaculis TaxID=1843537 RepID=A0AAE1PPK2_9EUCA|nr:hypothetical protein Pmani_016377 [Petrolisthes manimaculis]